MNVVLTLLGLVGATLIVVRGTIFSRLQNFYPPLFKCAQCTGMWVGMIAGAFSVIDTGHARPLNSFLVGCATSIASLFVAVVLLALLPED